MTSGTGLTTMPECQCRTKSCKLRKINHARLNFLSAFQHPWCLSASVTMMDVHIHGGCPQPCFMSMSMLYVYVHPACPCQCTFCNAMSMSRLHVHIHVHAACPCVCMCGGVGGVYVHVCVRACVCVQLNSCLCARVLMLMYKCGNAGLSGIQSILYQN